MGRLLLIAILLIAAVLVIPRIARPLQAVLPSSMTHNTTGDTALNASDEENSIAQQRRVSTGSVVTGATTAGTQGPQVGAEIVEEDTATGAVRVPRELPETGNGGVRAVPLR